MKEKFPEKSFDSGLNLLVKRMAISYLRRFLASEKQLCEQQQLEIVGLETELSATFSSAYSQHELRGFADRIDRLDGTLRVLDYKTGAFGKTEVQLDLLKDDLLNPKKSKAFQLLAYAWMYQRSTNDRSEISSAILSFRQLNAGPGELTIKNGQMDAELWATFEAALQSLVNKLFDPSSPIIQTEDLTECKKCDFRSICNR